MPLVAAGLGIVIKVGIVFVVKLKVTVFGQLGVRVVANEIEYGCASMPI